MLQGGDESGIKRSKKRITILVVAAMDDVLEKMIVINTVILVVQEHLTPFTEILNVFLISFL